MTNTTCRSPCGLAMFAILLLGAASAADDKKEEKSKVELKVVKLDGLEKTIADLKGKIVVMDFWADT